MFKPNEFKKSIHDIDLASLKNRGINNLIIDLDETIRKRNNNYIPEDSINWINNAKDLGFNVCISSNSFFPWKFNKIRKLLNVPCNAFALKPLPFAFLWALKTLNADRSNTAMIGDQLFTDIVGANLLGIYTIMIEPVTKDEKGIHRHFMRWLEGLFYKPT